MEKFVRGGVLLGCNGGSGAGGGAMTAAGVKALYESNADTNAFTDADRASIGDLKVLAFKGKVDYNVDIENLPLVYTQAQVNALLAQIDTAEFARPVDFVELIPQPYDSNDLYLVDDGQDTDSYDIYILMPDEDPNDVASLLKIGNTGANFTPTLSQVIAKGGALSATEASALRGNMESVVAQDGYAEIDATTSICKITASADGAIALAGVPAPQCTILIKATADIDVTIPTVIAGATDVYNFDDPVLSIPAGRCAEVDLLTVDGDVFIHSKVQS